MIPEQNKLWFVNKEHWPETEITLLSENIGEPLENNTLVPFSRTNLGEPEFNSKTEWENTLPLSEPGELIALENSHYWN